MRRGVLRCQSGFFAILAICVAGTAADSWPRFRGPNGSRISSSPELPVEFGPQKNLLWKVKVPFGRSSPIVTGDRIFLTASEGDNLITMCLERNTGRIMWRREIVRERAAEIYKANDPASPTPVTDGTNVYAFFADLGLVSYGPDGKIVMVSESGKVTVLNAGRDWEVLAVNDLGEDCWATPAIASGSLYIRARNTLYCFRKME